MVNNAAKTKQQRLDALEKRMLKADLPLKRSAHQLVFGGPNADASLMFVGEAPGKNEDLQGLPFIGSAGKILDQLLESIDVKREQTFITSILKYRPPNNRNPSMIEIIEHTPFLIDQIRIIQPSVIVPLGNFAAKFILNGFNTDQMKEVEGISKLHGQIEHVTFEGMHFTVVPLYHPAAVLYNPPLRKTLEEDFLVLKNLIAEKKESLV